MSDKRSLTRNSNIELLRILSIIGVIILHYNYELYGGAFSYVTPHSINEFILYLLEYSNIVAVDVFVLISGYFLSKNNSRSIIKPLKLIVQVVFIVVVFYLFYRIVFNNVSVVDYINRWCGIYWFVSIYIALYLVSPFVNLIFERLNVGQTKVFLAILIILFSVEPTLIDLLGSFIDCDLSYLYFISKDGSTFGFSIVNMVLVYSIGAYISRYPDQIKKINTTTYLLIYVFCVCVNSLLSFISMISISYCSPIVILESVVIFCFFLKKKQFTSPVINTISRNAFSVYLCHVYLLRFLSIPSYVNAVAPIMILHIVISCLSIYLIGWIIGQVYSVITEPLFSYLQKKINFYKYDIGD